MTPTVPAAQPPRAPNAAATAAALQAHQATLPPDPLTLDPDELAHLTVDTAAATVFPGPGGRPVQYRAATTPAGHPVTVELTGQTVRVFGPPATLQALLTHVSPPLTPRLALELLHDHRALQDGRAPRLPAARRLLALHDLPALEAAARFSTLRLPRTRPAGEAHEEPLADLIWEYAVTVHWMTPDGREHDNARGTAPDQLRLTHRYRDEHGQVWLTDHAHDTWIPLGHTPTVQA